MMDFEANLPIYEDNRQPDEQFEILSAIRYDNGLAPDFESMKNLDGIMSSQKTYLPLDPNSKYSSVEIKKVLVDATQGFQLDELVMDSKYNPKLISIFRRRFMMLRDHVNRLNLTLKYFKWHVSEVTEAELLVKLIQGLPSSHNNPNEIMEKYLNKRCCFKMRLLLSKKGNFKIEAHEISSPPIVDEPITYFVNTILTGFLQSSSIEWNVFVDFKPTHASPFTSFKTTNRSHYTHSRDRMSQLSKAVQNHRKTEILIVDSFENVLEGSTTNVVAIDQGNSFVTPPLKSGCLFGVMRCFLLRRGLVKEGALKVSFLDDKKEILLSNAIMGCVRGNIVKL